MRIIGGTRDYYEVLPNEKTDLPVYLRTERESELPVVRTTGRSWTKEGEKIGLFVEWVNAAPRGDLWFSDLNCKVNLRVLLFCGIPYAAWCLVDYRARDTADWVMNLSALKHPDPRLQDRLQASLEKDPRWGNAVTFAQEKRFRDSTPPREHLVEVHRYYDAPILLVVFDYWGRGKHRVTVNPNLVHDFPWLMATVPPHQAYSEIDMFLGSDLATQRDPIPERTQDLIRDKHGFDKWSFKTRPK